MAYDKNEVFSTVSSFSSGLRFFPGPGGIRPKTFASGTGTLAKGTPVAYNTSSDAWVLWGSTERNQISTVTANTTPASAGTFLLLVNGKATGTIAYNATAATIQTALEALAYVAVGDVTVTMTSGANLGVASAVAQIEFMGALADRKITLTIDTSSLTGNVHVLASTQTGLGLNEISKLVPGATPASAGDFTLTCQGITTTHVFDTTGAAAQAILRAAHGDTNVDAWSLGAGTDLGDAGHELYIVWKGDYADKVLTVTADFTGISTGDDHVLSEYQAGGLDNGAQDIKGFVWPSDVVLVSGSTVLGNVMMNGRVHYDDIVLPSGQTLPDLQAALRSGMRALGFDIEGLSNVR